MDIVNGESVIKRLDGYGLTIFDDIAEPIQNALATGDTTFHSFGDFLEFLYNLDGLCVIIDDEDDLQERFEELYEFPVELE
jgi:hypothetical protein